MGQTLCRNAKDRGGGRRAVVAEVRRAARIAAAALFALVALHRTPVLAQDAPERLDRGRFTAVFYPNDRALATSLLEEAAQDDTFPGLPRPHQHVLLAVAPDHRRFREWAGPGAPEWGAAITFPASQRIIMQGRASGSDAGDPREVFRHELAHLALHEFLGDLPPRWFDEGYASYSAREWNREDALAANLGLALRGAPTFDELDQQFGGGSLAAQNAYALAYRAIVELAELDTTAGLSRFFDAWRATGSMDRALRGEYGLTIDGFEHRWRQRTRRRYGALALVSDLSLVGVFLIIVVIPLSFVRRQRDRHRLTEMMAADEAAERAARADAIEALLRGDDWPDFGDGSPPADPS